VEREGDHDGDRDGAAASDCDDAAASDCDVRVHVLDHGGDGHDEFPRLSLRQV